MDTTDLKHHYSQQFNAELEDLRTRVLAMGGLVEQQLSMAINAVNRGESEAVENVVLGDRKVNAYDVDLDERCTKILALRQPAASDLRLVLTVIKMTTDLERIGDECKSVAQMALRAAQDDKGRNLIRQVSHLGTQVQQILHRALDSFARMDVDEALEIVHEDVNIDREYESVIRQSMTYMMEDPRSIPGVVDLIWAARALERIGDRCRNISQYVIYFVKGRDVRHTSLDDIKRELEG